MLTLHQQPLEGGRRGVEARTDDAPTGALRDHLPRGVLVAQEDALSVDTHYVLIIVELCCAAFMSGPKSYARRRLTVQHGPEVRDSRVRHHLGNVQQ